MNISDLLRYQEIEVNIHNIEKKLNETEQYKKFVTYETEKKQALQKVDALDKEAEKLINKVNDLEADIKDTIDKIAHLKSEINSTNDLDKLDNLEKNLLEYSKLLQKDNKDLEFINARQSAIFQEAKNNVSKHKVFNEKEKEIYGELKELKNQIDEQTLPLKKELAKLAQMLPQKALELYKVAKRNNKHHLVTIKDKGYCTGCGQDVELEVGKKIEENGIAECPRCFRVLYVE